MFLGRGGKAAKKAVKDGDVQALIQLLSDPDPKTRANTANACMDVSPGSADPALVAALMHAATDADAGVRGQAILALGSVRAADTADLFLQGLSDSDWLVRMFAATAIGWMPDPRAVEPVIGLLDEEEPLVRSAAAFTLGAIGDPAAVTALRAHLESERDKDVRSALEEALGKIQ